MQTLITLMSLGVVALDALILVGIALLFYTPARAKLIAASRSYGLLLIFLLSAISVAGTLFFQYGAGLNPCLLCWWQRVFMYPIPFISIIALVKGKRLSDIADYVITLSFIGGAIALYQHFLQILPAGSLIPCDSSGDCAIRSVFEFGFVTIPWMAVTVFAFIILIAILGRREPTA